MLALFIGFFSDDILGQVAAALYDAVASELAPYTGALPQGVQRPTWVQRSVCFSARKSGESGS